MRLDVKKLIVPRMILSLTGVKHYVFSPRNQLTVIHWFVITGSRAQRQSYSRVGVDMWRLLFTLGKLSIMLSQFTIVDYLSVLVPTVFSTAIHCNLLCFSAQPCQPAVPPLRIRALCPHHWCQATSADLGDCPVVWLWVARL
jgi:hypothetical protein